MPQTKSSPLVRRIEYESIERRRALAVFADIYERSPEHFDALRTLAIMVQEQLDAMEIEMLRLRKRYRVSHSE